MKTRLIKFGTASKFQWKPLETTLFILIIALIVAIPVAAVFLLFTYPIQTILVLIAIAACALFIWFLIFIAKSLFCR
jgi:hypothetical protein